MIDTARLERFSKAFAAIETMAAEVQEAFNTMGYEIDPLYLNEMRQAVLKALAWANLGIGDPP